MKTMSVKAGPVWVKMLVRGDRLCWKILDLKSPYEPETLEVWCGLCKSGGIALDIGAATGLFAISGELMGCHVIAFEPMAKHTRRIAENADINGVTPDIRNVAVSDRIGTAELSVNPNVTGFTHGASLLHHTSGQGREKKIPVETVTIDSLGLTSLTAIKIDVERGEPMVLAGAQETLQRLRPPMLVEMLGDDERAAVRAAVPFYEPVRQLDRRNWLMVAK